MRRLFPLAVLMLLLAPAGPADAAQKRKGRTIDKSPHLWATVNICDSEQSPDSLGIRASMPGSGSRRERMYMRFRAQYRSAADGRWHDFTTEGADSGWVRVGSARYKARQSGWKFRFELQPGQRHELRGVVKFEWRRGKKVVRRATKSTRSGHKADEAEPKGYSAATCVISG
jgi:hypothetical protein